MFRIALIQNESEMMRYSWADIRPMLQRLEYPFDGFTGENIDDLYSGLSLERYDAIIVASNACNDKTVRESLENHKTELETFLKTGKGILISHQIKMADFKFYEFLPNPFKITAINRIYYNESPQDGNLVLGEGQEGHTILCFPSKIDIAKMKNECLSNNLVEGLYWIYLKPDKSENYITLLEDNTYTPTRKLLISSRPDFESRIVISALALDWQKHNELWENAVRYVVEGRPSIAVVSKSGSSEFDFRFLISTLEIGKIPNSEYTQDSITPNKMALDVHDTYVLDPAWSDNEVDNFVQTIASLIESGQARVLYFGKKIHGRPILQTVSNVREYQIIARNAITWLISQYPDAEDEGYWDGSFWCTVDALFTLDEFGISVTQFKDKILKKIEKHDRHGSYDEVLGATCAMFEIYNLFLGKTHTKTQRALDWILVHVHDKTLFEKASAYDVLTRLEIEVEQHDKFAFKNEIMENIPSLDNEFLIYRYAKTLFTCGFIKEAEQVVMRLEKLQNPNDGSWVNIPNTAALVELLIDIQNATGSPKQKIDEMIFKGIQFLRTTYSQKEFSWKSDVSATAKALKALHAFENRISFPLDIMNAIMLMGDTRARNYIAIETASAMNIKLQDRVSNLTKRIRELQHDIEKLNIQNSFAVRLSVILTVIVSSAAAFGLIFTKYLIENELFHITINHFKIFISQSALFILSTLVLVTVLILVYVLKRLGKWPKWLTEFLAPILKTEVEEEI